MRQRHLYSQFQNRGWKLHGTDQSPTGIEIAHQYLPEIDFFLSDASAPAEETLKRLGLVDAIISTEVIKHLYDPRGFLQNALSMIKPGGVVILSTPYQSRIHQESVAGHHGKDGPALYRAVGPRTCQVLVAEDPIQDPSGDRIHKPPIYGQRQAAVPLEEHGPASDQTLTRNPLRSDHLPANPGPHSTRGGSRSW